MKFFLITSDHLSDRLWFKDTEDFIVAMNYVAIVAFKYGCCVLAFILMSNHVHFVLAEDREKSVLFINEFKKMYSKYLSKKYNGRKHLKRNDIDLRELSPYDESLERAIAYVQMNSVAAGLCLSPSEYPWGTGRCFFRPIPAKGTKAGELSGRKLRHTIHSRERVPDCFLICEEGYILPESYVAVDFVESLFRRAQRMKYFLDHSSKASKRLFSEQDIPSFKDQILIAAIPDLCRGLFRKNSFKELEEGEKAELLKQLRYRFSSNINQLCRVTGLEYSTAASLLDSI